MVVPSKDREPSTFDVRVLRQNGPDQPSRWERHRIAYEPNLNVISVLQKIAASATNAAGNKTTPIAWECNCLEEVCGSCTMLVNGRTQQACSSLVDTLLAEHPDEIELRPMSKFPVVRDLVVNRERMFRALQRIKAWIPVDDYTNRGPGPKESQKSQQRRYPLAECMTCGCCLEACPQYHKIEPKQRVGESEEQFKQRKLGDFDKGFLGAAAISQAILFNSHETGTSESGERIESLTAPGGIQICGNAQNCVAVCPKEIPLTTSIARAGRAATVHLVQKWFDH